MMSSGSSRHFHKNFPAAGIYPFDSLLFHIRKYFLHIFLLTFFRKSHLKISLSSNHRNIRYRFRSSPLLNFSLRCFRDSNPLYSLSSIPIFKRIPFAGTLCSFNILSASLLLPDPTFAPFLRLSKISLLASFPDILVLFQSSLLF